MSNDQQSQFEHKSEGEIFGLSIIQYCTMIGKQIVTLLLIVGLALVLRELVSMGKFRVDAHILSEFNSFLEWIIPLSFVVISIWAGIVVKDSIDPLNAKYFFGGGVIVGVIVGLAMGLINSVVTFVFKIILEGDIVNSVFYLISFLWKSPAHMLQAVVAIEIVLAIFFFKSRSSLKVVTKESSGEDVSNASSVSNDEKQETSTGDGGDTISL